MGTIQLPSSWRATMEEAGTMQLFFELHAASAHTAWSKWPSW